MSESPQDTRIDNLYPRSDYFPFLEDAPLSIQKRIKSYQKRLEGGDFQDSIYTEDPIIPEDSEDAKRFIEQYMYSLRGFSSTYPVVTYYRLTQILREIGKIERFTESPIYLGLMASWIQSASQSGDASSVQDIFPELEQVIEKHIEDIYISSGDDEERYLSEDSIVQYREHLLTLLDAISRFCIQIGQYDIASKYIHKGIQISEHMFAGESVFRFFLLELGNLSSYSAGISLHSLKQIFSTARNGLEKIAGRHKDKKLAEEMKSQLGISELLLVTQKADLGDIKVIKGIISSYTHLSDTGISDEYKLKLAYIEILLYKAIQSILSRRVEVGADGSVDNAKENLMFIARFGKRISQDGFLVERLPENINIYQLLPVLVEYLDLQCGHPMKKGPGTIVDESPVAYELMIRIFRLAAGSTHSEENLKVISRSTYFRKYIELAKILLNDKKLSKKGVIDRLRGIVTEKDRQAQISHRQLLKNIQQKWKLLIKVSISDGSSGNNSYIINDHEGKVYVQEFEIPFNEIFFKISLDLSQPPLTESQLTELKRDVALLIPYENQRLITEKLKSISKTLRHDCINIFGGINSVAGMVQRRVVLVRDEIRELLNVEGNPHETTRRLENLLEKVISPMEKMVHTLHKGTTGALRFAERIPEAVQKSLEKSNERKLQKSPHEIGTLIHEIVALYHSNEHLHINLDFPDMFSQDIMLDEVSFRGMLGNFIQNAIRYRKVNQYIAMVEIRLEQQASGELLLSIRDNGQGMNKKDMRTYKESHRVKPEYDASAHEDSEHLGAGSVMHAIESHGWRLDIESNPGEFVIFSIVIPKEDLVSGGR